MSYQVIARKHRPQTFEDVVGQEHVTRTLKNALRENRVAHAYIFSGARGVGKTTTARILAKCLNCVQGPTAKPCNACDACREIAAGSSLDVMEIDAASNRGIDEVRELREMVRYVAASGRHKVVILDEAHMLTNEASNALLKTLEEPPEKVIFVMATTEPEKLQDTIRSRSQHFHFRALSFQEISDALTDVAKEEKLKVEPGALAVMARAAEGSLRDGLSLLEQAIAYCGEQVRDAQVRELLGVVAEEVLDELVQAISESSAERALGLVHRLLHEGRNLQHFCREAIGHFRNLLVAKVSGADSELITAQPDERPRLAKQAAEFSEEDLTRFFQILLQTDDDLRRRPDPRLHLEMGLLRLVNAGRLASLEEALAGIPEDTAVRQRGTGSTSGSGAPGKRSLAPSEREARGAAQRATAVNAGPTATQEADNGKPANGDTAIADSGNGSAAEADPDQRVAAIKTAIHGRKKLLWSLVEHVKRWEIEAGEVRLFYPAENRALAEILQGREQMETLRTIIKEVLGQAARVCVKLETSATAPRAVAAAAGGEAGGELRAAFEQDPIVRAMLERFGGRVAEVKRGSGEQ